jgi:hypothetical protein
LYLTRNVQHLQNTWLQFRTFKGHTLCM